MKYILEPPTLWQCGNCCSSCIALNRAASQRKESNLLPVIVFFLKMVIRQDIVNFRRDFISARIVRVDCGNADSTEKEAARDFIHRLDTTQFGGFQQFINNQIAAPQSSDPNQSFLKPPISGKIA